MEEPELKIIDVFICKLRKKLAEATGGDHYIETVWGRGYIMRDPVEAVVELAATLNLPAAARTVRQAVRLLAGTETSQKLPRSPARPHTRPNAPGNREERSLRLRATGYTAGIPLPIAVAARNAGTRAQPSAR